MSRELFFGRRTVFCLGALMLAGLLLPWWHAGRVLDGDALEDATAMATREARLMAWMVSRDNGLENADLLQDRLIEIQEQTGIKSAYVAADGRLIACSAGSAGSFSGKPCAERLDVNSAATVPVQGERGEIDVGVRFETLGSKEQIVAVARVSGNGSIPDGALYVAAPSLEVKGGIASQVGGSVIAVLCLFLLGLVFSQVRTRLANEEIRIMREAVEAIADQDLKPRIHLHPGSAFYSLAQSINLAAERMGNHFEAIAAEKEQLKAVFDSMQEGVMVLNSKGRIQNVNQALSYPLFSASRMTGRKPLEAMMSLELQAACDEILTSENGEEPQTRNLQISLEEDRWYDVSIVRLRARERDRGAVVVFHDISALKRVEKVRQDFVANVSHELRTPLTSIQGYAETLLSEVPADPETMSSFLQVILKNSNHMVRMVDDLLHLATLEAPNKHSSSAPVEAGKAFALAWKTCVPLAEARNVRLETGLPEEGISVMADFEQLVRVFRNLIENAIKYTPEGEGLSVFHRPEHDGIAFGVRDTGAGIPREHQQRVFERFYRVEKHRSDRFGSTGLGLAICRHIIRNHGGRIWIQSPNAGDIRGTTVYFTLARADSGLRNAE